MKPLVDNVTTKRLADQCVRITGRTVEDWEAEWRRRRVTHLRNRRLNGQALFTADAREEAIKYYDLRIEDFETLVGVFSTATDLMLPEEMRDLERVRIEGDFADETRKKHTGPNKTQKAPLAACAVYRLRQSCLRRIAAEAKELQLSL